MKHLYINYIVEKFCEKYPTASSETFKNILLKYSEEEVYRLANKKPRGPRRGPLELFSVVVQGPPRQQSGEC